MTQERRPTHAWVHGFVTGVAVCTLGAYLGRKYAARGPRIVRDDGTVIPIE